jgi:hypothetical protein
MRRAGILPVILLAAGCSLLAPQPDRSRFYVLSAVAEANPHNEPSGTASGAPIVTVGPLQIPDYLDRPEIVTRVMANRVVFSDVDRWAESLEVNCLRVIAQNLTRLLPGAQVAFVPALVTAMPDYQVPIKLLQFERTDDGQVALAAQWSIIDDRRAVETRLSTITEAPAGSDTAALIAALSRATARLSAEIATALRAASAAQRQDTEE